MFHIRHIRFLFFRLANKILALPCAVHPNYLKLDYHEFPTTSNSWIHFFRGHLPKDPTESPHCQTPQASLRISRRSNRVRRRKQTAAQKDTTHNYGRGAREKGTKRKLEGFFSEEEKNKIKILLETRRQKNVLHSSERDRVRVGIGPLQDPVTWYGINYAETQITQWGSQNKRTLTSPARLSFVLKVPLCYLRPSVISSVPCDRILQRAYWGHITYLPFVDVISQS